MKTQRSLSIFLSALAFLGTTSTLTNAVQAQDQIAQSTPISRMLRTLTVSGRGTESIQTTIAQVRLGVEAQGKTAGEVQAAIAKRSNAVVTFLKSRNVEKLETTGINLNPVYSYENNKQVLTGYSGSNMVVFRTNNNAAGEIVDQSVRSGASRIDGISFIATDEAIAAAQKIALRRATQEAQAQANAVLNVLNFTQKDIISIQVNNAVPRLRPMEMNDSMLQARSSKIMADPTPVLGGEQTIEASVTLEITY
ncbi:MAG: SIMPL domain-containing protein [Cyanobacteria bacterium]|nr:SIMPL domain-containing protein [Cyanobacteriota bacterium]